MPYLNYAGIGLLRRPAIAALHAAVDQVLARGAAEYGRLFAARAAAQAAAGRLLECDPDEVAMVSNTSAGIHLVADGLDWRAGDEVVVFDRDFPANVQPWRRLADRGVVLRWIPMRNGGYELDDVADAIGPATRLIAVSHVNFISGFRIDLDELCRLAQPVGALVCVDAVQSLGVLPLSVARTPIDFLAAGGHKWLCAPPGTGLFYCRRDRMDLLRWAPPGWTGYDGAAAVLHEGAGHLDYELPLRPDARRFEGGMLNLLGLVGLASALEELVEIGVDAVASRVLLLTARLREGLAEHGYTVLSPAGAARSGIVSFVHIEKSGEELFKLLEATGCHVAYPDGKLRASPHYWTSEAELDEFIAVL
jgi:cysteine desulfurase / selenocysteine lyase